MNLYKIDERLNGLTLEELAKVERLIKIKIKTARWNSNEWCECIHEQPGDKVSHFDDNKHSVTKKHHYRCDDCGGIWQMG